MSPDFDDLSKELSNMKTGCHFNDVNVNHLVYADDTVLLAPSPSALQKLINQSDVECSTKKVPTSTPK